MLKVLNGPYCIQKTLLLFIIIITIIIIIPWNLKFRYLALQLIPDWVKVIKVLWLKLSLGTT